jgi:hypothetical protein
VDSHVFPWEVEPLILISLHPSEQISTVRPNYFAAGRRKTSASTTIDVRIRASRINTSRAS